MWEARDTNTADDCTIYVQLLNEGTIGYRPTQARLVKRGVDEVLPTPNYNAVEEDWEFPPGSLVECVAETRNNTEILIAIRNAALK